jgi:hypothetical protein
MATGQSQGHRFYNAVFFFMNFRHGVLGSLKKISGVFLCVQIGTNVPYIFTKHFQVIVTHRNAHLYDSKRGAKEVLQTYSQEASQT